MTVAADPTFAGVFGFESERFGSLDDQTFTVGANDYTTRQVSLIGTVLTFGTTNSALTAGEQAVLRLHVCAADLDFSAAPVPTGHVRNTFEDGLVRVPGPAPAARHATVTECSITSRRGRRT